MTTSQTIRRCAAGGAALAAAAVLAGCDLGAPRVSVDVPAVAVATGDLNGDGVPDLATVGEDTLAIHLSDGAGGLVTATYPQPDPSGWMRLTHVALVDVDVDGDLDVVLGTDVHQFGVGAVSYLPNDGDGTLGTHVHTWDGAQIDDMVVGRTRGDGIDELIVMAGGVRVWHPTTAGLGAPTVVPDSVGYGVDVADVDGDGLGDVLVGLGDDVGRPPSVAVFLSTPGGSSPPALYATGSDLRGIFAVRAGDLDGDGAPDLVVGSSETVGLPAQSTGIVSVLPGNGDGTFGPPVVVDDRPLAAASDIELADIDGDGSLDVVVNGSTILIGDGTGGFTAVRRLALTGAGVEGDAVVADLDGDGSPDVAATRTILDVFPNHLAEG